jgi:exopolysaccharide biosynthesis polyprenyl glycosylphosphotransferase
MTQTSVPAQHPSSTPLVPRPRLGGVDVPTPGATIPGATIPGAATPEPQAGARATAQDVIQGTAVVMALDAALAVALAASMVLAGRLPAHVAALAAAAWPLLLLVTGSYRHRSLDHSRATRMRSVLGTGLRAAVVTLAASPWLTTIDSVSLALLVALFSVASCVPPLVGARRARPRLVLAGRPRDVRDALVELRAAGHHEIVATCLTRPSVLALGEVPAFVGFERSSAIAELYRADAFVLLPGTHLSAAEVRRLHWALAGVRTELCVGTGLLDVHPERTRVFASGGLNLLHVAPAPLRGPRRWLKDVVERLAATVGLVLLLPALLVVAAVVRADSPGPAFYRQARVGRDGRRFTIYKFRSMSCSADVERLGLTARNEADGVLFKIQQDPRVTRVGAWLRRWSVDEVPQLWNVVRGDMSLVGPRPALPEEVARYDVDPTRRLAVKPGLTGLWQVSGRSDLSWAEAVRLDVKYVENWSLRLDVAILLRTVRAVVDHRGAY